MFGGDGSLELNSVYLLQSSRMWNLKFVLLTVSLAVPGFVAEDFEDEEFQSSDAARKFWGIQDVTISVGKLLHCKIPPDAFKGHIVSYDVSFEVFFTGAGGLLH